MALQIQDAFNAAVEAGIQSPCAKSKRGVAVWLADGSFLVTGHNHPPEGFACDGSAECRAQCAKHCIHAEIDALLKFPDNPRCLTTSVYMLHVKVVDGVAVRSGPPSCVDCSKTILHLGIHTMFLYHEEGFKGYPADEFHELTLKYCHLPVIRKTKP